MYTREQASQLRQAFWTAFGQYMSPLLSADGFRTNWINYNTGFKDVYFKMEAGQKQAFIGVLLTHKDIEIQQLYFEQFEALKRVLQERIGESWDWELHARNEHGKTISRIYKVLGSVNVFNQDDWPQLISFFKPRIIALDDFWSDARYTFEALR